MTSTNNTTLYTGVTNNLQKRVWEHKNRTGSQFTSKYKISKLVYCESFARITDAITAEKRVKSGSRVKKIRLIEAVNPKWQDLYEQAQS